MATHSILLAMDASEISILQEALHPTFNLKFCTTYGQALAVLAEHRENIHLILCEQRFAGSCMIDLLRHVKASSAVTHIPFVCLSMSTGLIDRYEDDRGIAQALEIVARNYGAERFVDFKHWTKQFGDTLATAMLVSTLLACIAPEKNTPHSND